MTPDLIDHVYEAALLPELWPQVLSEVADLVSARGGVLFTANPEAGILRWAASETLREDMATYVSDGWLMQGARLENLRTAEHSGFLVEADIFGEAELAGDPTYRDFLRPRGLGWAAGTAISLPTHDVLVLSLEREYARGPVETETIRLLDDLRPHLARSALLSARLQMERARTVSETLGQLGLPALVVDGRNTVLAANSLIEALDDQISWRAQDQISLKDLVADALLRQALATLGDEASTSVRSFAVRSADAHAALVAHLIPIRGAARDLFARSLGILVMTPVTMPQAPPVELVQSLFDLTPSEARVARGLAAGDTLGMIAAGRRVSKETIRAQVRGIFDKTGCRRQSDVVALLSGIAAPKPR